MGGRLAFYFLLFLFLIFSEFLFLLDSGKTAMAARVGIDSDFPYVKIVRSEPIFRY